MQIGTKLVSAWRKVIEEVRMLLLSVNYKVEDSLIKNQTKLFIHQYFLVGVAICYSHISALVIYLSYLDNPGVKQRITLILIVFCIPLMLTISVFWMDKTWVKITGCFLGCIPSFFWTEWNIRELEKNSNLSYARNFPNMIRFFAIFHLFSMANINQPLKVKLSLMLVEKLYFLLRMPSAVSSQPVTVLSVRACFTFMLHIFFSYLYKHTVIIHYSKLNEKKKNVEDVIKLLETISIFPVYVVKMDNIEGFVNKKVDLESRSSLQSKSSGLTELREIINRQQVVVFHSRGEKKTEIIGNELFSELEKIFFNNESKFSLTRDQKVVVLEEIETSNAELRAVKCLLREIFESEFEKQNLSDVIIRLYLMLFDYGLRCFDYQFNFRYLSNNTILQSKEQKFYDIDIMFINYDDMPAIVIKLKDMSERIIRDNLEEKNQGMDRVLSSLTHDMRAPLHAILGYSEILNFKIGQFVQDNSDAYEEKVKKIRANCEHLSLMVNDILDSTRLANDKFIPLVTEFDLAALAKECLEIAKVVQDSKDVKFLYMGPSKLIINSDSHRIKRVLLNFVANSVKFTEKGSIKIELLELQNSILIKVIDTGKGIAKNIQKNLFNPFIAYSKESSKTPEGIGLGLSTTRELVAKLGPSSKINIKSDIGKGCCFSFEIYKYIQEEKTPTVEKNDSKKDISFRKGGEKTNSKLRSFDRTHALKKVNLFPSDKTINETHLKVSSKEIRLRSNSLGDSTTRKQVNNDISGSEVESPSPGLEPKCGILPFTEPKKEIGFKSLMDQKIAFKKKRSARVISNEISIFLLEDDTFNRDILNMYLLRYFSLASSNFKVRIDMRLTVPEAIQLIKENCQKTVNYSIIFTDYHLGEGMTGPDFVREVKKIYTARKQLHPSFVLVSGRSMTESEDSGLFFKCILKPFSFDNFSGVMDKWMEATDRKHIDTSPNTLIAE